MKSPKSIFHSARLLYDHLEQGPLNESQKPADKNDQWELLANQLMAEIKDKTDVKKDLYFKTRERLGRENLSSVAPQDLNEFLKRFPTLKDVVAQNQTTPRDVLKNLATDADSDIRIIVARNSNSPTPALEKLATDPVEEVRQALAFNNKCPVPLLVKLGNNPKETAKVKQAVALNPSTPPGTLTKLSLENSVLVRETVAVNPNTIPDVLRKLATDKNERVRKAAQARLSHP